MAKKTMLNKTTMAYAEPGKAVQLTISKNGREVELWEVKASDEPGLTFEISRDVPDVDGSPTGWDRGSPRTGGKPRPS